MQFQHRFKVTLPIEAAWDLLLDIERIAPCVPGATLEGIQGEECKGSVKVKLGPITSQYKGTVTFTEKNPAERRLVAQAKGRDVHGQGSANSTVTMRLQDEGDATLVQLDTDLQITGKAAQLGKGVMQEVSGRIIDQFARNLEREVAEAVRAVEAAAGSDPGEVATVEASEAPTLEASEAPTVEVKPAAPAADEAGAAQAPASRAAPAVENAPIDLMEVARASILKRAGIAAAVIAALAALAWLI
ncbi:MAG: SRPBCC family protein [Gammaproteobacteria bacterium]